MLLMEVGNKVGIEDETGGDPCPLFWTVPLPVDQILEALAPAPGAAETSHHVDWPSIDEAWRRRGRSSRDQWTLPKQLDLGDVEGGMDPHRMRELELNRLIIFWISNRPINPGASFLEQTHSGRCLVNSYTLWLTR